MRAKDHRREEFWFKRSDLARVFAITVSHFTREIAPLARPEHVKAVGSGTATLYFARGLIDQYVARQAGSGATNGNGHSAAAQGSLEQWRATRAEIAAIELRRLSSQLVPREDVRAFGEIVAGELRRAGETLKRQWGNDAQEILDAAMDAMVRAAEDRFSESVNEG